MKIIITENQYKLIKENISLKEKLRNLIKKVGFESTTRVVRGKSTIEPAAQGALSRHTRSQVDTLQGFGGRREVHQRAQRAQNAQLPPAQSRRNNRLVRAFNQTKRQL